MKNTKSYVVTLGDDLVIEVSLQGTQSPESLTDVIAQVESCIAKVKQQKRSVLVLVHLRGISRVSVSTRRFAANALRKLTYDRVAIYGVSRLFERIIELVVRAVGKEDQIQVFPERQPALDWLTATFVAEQIVEKHGPETAYRAYVANRLDQLNDLISLAVIGEYSKDIPIPKEEDEFTDTFVGLRVLIETLEEKARRISEMSPSKNNRASVLAGRRVLKSNESSNGISVFRQP
jgi:hypothetical protein